MKINYTILFVFSAITLFTQTPVKNSSGCNNINTQFYSFVGEGNTQIGLPGNKTAFLYSENALNASDRFFGGANDDYTTGEDEFAGGSGTSDDPWLISTPEHLNNVRNYLGASHEDKHFEQVNNINLDIYPWNEGSGWLPIGSQSSHFMGNYDGGGYSIEGLYINRQGTNNVGLWSYIGNEGKVYSIKLEDTDVSGGAYGVGTLTGYNLGIISDAYATGSVSGGYRAGGLVGENNPGTVENSGATVDVIANDGRIGGLVGFNVQGTVYDSFAAGDVTGGWYVGGLVGRNYNGTVKNSYATGAVDGSNCIGGLVGDSEGGLIFDNYATGDASGGFSVGGLVGYVWQTTIDNTYAIGGVSGSMDAGGLIGYNFGGTVSHSFWNTETSGQTSSSGGTGKTTEEMILQETFSEWDFDNTWSIIEEVTYPYLIWQEEPGSHNFPYEKHHLNLIANPKEGGDVYGEGYYEEGEEVEINAQPAEDWRFVEWTGDTEHVDNPEQATANVTMPAEDITLTACFELLSTDLYMLTLLAEPTEGGNTIGEGEYKEGEEVEIVAQAAENWKFVEWTGDTEHVDNPKQATANVTMPAEDITLTACFELLSTDLYMLTLLADPTEGGNTIGEGEYKEGEEVEIVAQPAENWKFVEWAGDTQHIDNPEQATANVTMPANNTELTANFKNTMYTEHITEPNIMIFPNPASNRFIIKSNKPVKKIRLINKTGQIVKNTQINESYKELDVHNIPPGAYIMQIYLKETLKTLNVQIAR